MGPEASLGWIDNHIRTYFAIGAPLLGSAQALRCQVLAAYINVSSLHSLFDLFLSVLFEQFFNQIKFCNPPLTIDR